MRGCSQSSEGLRAGLSLAGPSSVPGGELAHHPHLPSKRVDLLGKSSSTGFLMDFDGKERERKRSMKYMLNYGHITMGKNDP